MLKLTSSNLEAINGGGVCKTRCTRRADRRFRRCDRRCKRRPHPLA